MRVRASGTNAVGVAESDALSAVSVAANAASGLASVMSDIVAAAEPRRDARNVI